VTQTSNDIPQSQPLSPAARILWLVLILSTLYLCYFHNLGALGLVGPDEPRYAWIARDMQETGDWVTPRLYGKPWFEKPPLYYWSAALSFKLFGVSETTARLPSAIAALLATLALAWLTLRLYGAETARWLLLLLPTTGGMIGFSHAAATDMPFAAMLTISMVFATKLLNLVPSVTTQSQISASSASPFRSFASFTSSTSFTSFFFGVFLGLATLAKGPAAIILSGGAVLLWAIFTRRWRDAIRCLHPFAIASFCLTALPWYILCSRRNPDFFRVFIIEHNFNRFLTPQFQHIQPIWYYVPISLIAIFPWIFFHALAKLQFLTNWNERRPESHSQAFLLTWAGFTFLFFTLAKSKLPGYILPTVPPLALLMANAAASTAKNKSCAPRWPLFGTGLGLLIIGIVLQRQAHRIPSLDSAAHPCGTSLFWATAVLGGVAVGVLAASRGIRTGLFATVLTTLLLVAELQRLLPDFDAGVSARSAAYSAGRIWPAFSPQTAATWQLNRSYVYQLNYYTHKEIPDWNPSQPSPPWLFVGQGKQREAASFGFRCAEFVATPAVIPCSYSGSLGGLNGGNARNKLGDRQPRQEK
jgi:4-amino-4-deoxy-L-arabinose transferase-like glycosyltransferase